MNQRKITIAILEAAGYILDRHGSNHDIYVNPETGIKIPVKRHDFDEDDKRYVLKEAKLDHNQTGKRKGKG